MQGGKKEGTKAPKAVPQKSPSKSPSKGEISTPTKASAPPIKQKPVRVCVEPSSVETVESPYFCKKPENKQIEASPSVSTKREISSRAVPAEQSAKKPKLDDAAGKTEKPQAKQQAAVPAKSTSTPTKRGSAEFSGPAEKNGKKLATQAEEVLQPLLAGH